MLLFAFQGSDVIVFSCTGLPLVRDTHNIVRSGCSIPCSSRTAGVLASYLSTEVTYSYVDWNAIFQPIIAKQAKGAVSVSQVQEGIHLDLARNWL